MGVFSNIQAALNTRLSTLVNSPPIQWSNTRYQTSENTAFIRPTILPNNTTLDTLAGTEYHIGIYQVDVFVPLEKGVNSLDTLLDNIQSLFKSNRTLVSEDVTVLIQSISRGPETRQEAWYASFLEINYICFYN